MAAVTGTAAAKIAISAAMTAATTVMQGVQAKKTAKFNASQSRMIAERERQVAQLEADELRNDESRRRAAVRALRGGANTGTALTLLQDMAGEAEFEALKVESGGAARAGVRENEARGFEFRGRQAMTSAFMRAGSSVINGASKFGKFGAPATSVNTFSGFQGM